MKPQLAISHHHHSKCWSIVEWQNSCVQRVGKPCSSDSLHTSSHNPKSCYDIGQLLWLSTQSQQQWPTPRTAIEWHDTTLFCKCQCSHIQFLLRESATWPHILQPSIPRRWAELRWVRHIQHDIKSSICEGMWRIFGNQWSLDWFKGKFTGNLRKPWYLPLNIGGSCKISLKPIQWNGGWIKPRYLHVTWYRKKVSVEMKVDKVPEDVWFHNVPLVYRYYQRKRTTVTIVCRFKVLAHNCLVSWTASAGVNLGPKFGENALGARGTCSQLNHISSANDQTWSRNEAKSPQWLPPENSRPKTDHRKIPGI